jgi:UDP-galactopyranose mutase
VPGREAYYPLADDASRSLYNHYASLASGEKNIIFGGRLGEYRYYDMDEVIESALKTVEKELR